MALSIKDPEATRLAKEVAKHTGETMTQAVIIALRERLLQVERKSQDTENLVDELMSIGKHFASLPVIDERRLEEMLYNEDGLPI